jgi:hypothetical protein
MTASSPTTLAKHELTDTEHDVLDDIFRLAVDRSMECQTARAALLRQGASDDGKSGTDELGAFELAVTRLCARIAQAAIARVPILAPLHLSNGALIGLSNPDEAENLDRFLRPIFVEAGVLEDYLAPTPGGLVRNLAEVMANAE